jgi:hypothetical protein
MSLITTARGACCVACLRTLSDIKPPPDAIGFDLLTCASFIPPAATGRGRLGICRDCSRAIVAAFAHAIPKERTA